MTQDYEEQSGTLASEKEAATRDEEIKAWRAILASYWWPQLCDRLKREETIRDRRLRRSDGKDVAYENRLRGAADALAWMQTFMTQEVAAYDAERKLDLEEKKQDEAAKFYAEHGRFSPYDPPVNPA